MITTKQRAYLRGLGAKLTPIFQIGKNGIEDNFLKQVDDALEAREILKINVLENSGLETREASNFYSLTNLFHEKEKSYFLKLDYM